jgi:hypothetical protein
MGALFFHAVCQSLMNFLYSLDTLVAAIAMERFSAQPAVGAK